MLDRPYISVIAVGRSNAANLAFTTHWNASAQQYGLSSEVLIAPPPGRNAAMRQARGEFVLCTRADAEFSSELIQFLATRQLREDRLYRLDCHMQGPDFTALRTREGTFRLTAEGLRENAARDIAPGNSGIHFGEGWFPPEGAPEAFRWMENRAEILLQGGGAVELEVEPGPGAGPLAQTLRVLDRRGVTVAEFALRGRAVLRLWLPADAGGFRLETPDGGRALAGDLRILNLRCLRCERVSPPTPAVEPRSLESMQPTLLRLLSKGGWLQLPATMSLLNPTGSGVFGPGIEYWGEGWHRLEQSGSEQFHWVDRDAELVVRIPAEPQDLCLLVEPGPSLHGQPFELVVRLAGGTEIARAKINGVTPLRLPLPFAPGSAARLLLSPDRVGDPLLPGDRRVLNFRVFACACRTSARPSAEIVHAAAWPAVRVRETPAAIDWVERLAPAQAQLQEIGKPAFLHVNGCDFILLSRRRWLELRGFPETGDLPEFMEALLCYAAHFAGAEEEVLRLPLRMTRPWDENEPTPLDDELIWMITQMRRLRSPVIVNGEGWGRE
ncbi:MAG: hypothetical protein ABI806_05280 [Candidatus Solibacter sp.]